MPTKHGVISIALQLLFLISARALGFPAFASHPSNTLISPRNSIRLGSTAETTESDLSADEVDRLAKKEIVVSSSIILPFDADAAFSAFADLPRQPSWSAWLHSVSYIENESSETTYTDCGIPILETKWVMRWKKAFRFSWRSKVTKLERPHEIRWESTSGLKNMGRILFAEDESGADNNNAKTTMTLEMTFIAPRIVASILKRSDRISSFMEDQILAPTLVNFRNTVWEDDLGNPPLMPKDEE